MPDLGPLGALITLALLIEATMQIFFRDIKSPISSLLKCDDGCRERVLSALIGIAYAFNMDIDIFTILGYPSSVPWIGTVATGLICSRGADFIHEYFGRFARQETII